MKFYHSLFVKLFFSFFGLSILSLTIMGWITYQNAAESLNKQLNVEAESIFDHNFKVLSLYLDDLNRMGDSIASSSIVSNFLKNKDTDTYLSSFPQLDEVIRSAHSIRPENVGITLISESGYIYYYGYSLDRDQGSFESFNWLPSPAEFSGASYVTAVHRRPYNQLKDDQPVFSFVQQLYSDDLRSKGKLIVDFKLDALNNLFPLETNLTFNIKDQNEQTVYPYHDQETSVPSNPADYRLVQRSDQMTHWTMSAYYAKDKWYEPVRNVREMFIRMAIVSLIICMIVSLLISNRLATPIKQLRLLMKRVEKGDFDLHFQITSKDEVGSLGVGFNQMVKKIKELIALVYMEQNQKRKAEIAALQAQINPHFLYNTLESINSLARKSKEKEISKMIVLLGKLLRISIRTRDELVPLFKELEYVKLYLEIHKLRLKKQIEYSIHVDPEIYRLYTVKWIFQPIIENAIIHGLEKRENGTIEITGWIHENDIWIELKDNGVGMEKEKLQALTSALENDWEQLSRNEENIGLFNVQSRIKFHFGRKYGIQLDSVINQGMKITIKLPRREYGEDI